MQLCVAFEQMYQQTIGVCVHNLRWCLANLKLLSIYVLPYQTLHRCKVKLVHKDHPWDQDNVVLIHRWSFYAGSITWTVYHWGPGKCRLYTRVVFVCKICYWAIELQCAGALELCVLIGGLTSTPINGGGGGQRYQGHSWPHVMFLFILLYIVT